MKCEMCEKDHDSSYGSGRFCCSTCARGFSTKAKRKEINEKISKKLTGINTITGEQAKEPIFKNCKYCKKLYSTSKYLQRFCCSTCANLYRSKQKFWTIEDFNKKYGFFPKKWLYDITSTNKYNDKYNVVYVSNHPDGMSYIREHRVVLEMYLGRFLKSSEVVHHKDGNGLNNALSNLEIITKSVHGKVHGVSKIVSYSELTCAFCGEVFKRKSKNVNSKVKQGQKDFYCSRSCAGKFSKKN